jgi:hypothetical protein
MMLSRLWDGWFICYFKNLSKEFRTVIPQMLDRILKCSTILVQNQKIFAAVQNPNREDVRADASIECTQPFRKTGIELYVALGL